MNDRPKRGSSRRKGDEFQDLTALRLVLELYVAHEEFRVFLEYEQAEAFDDIVIFTAKGIRAVQAKYAVDPLAVYVPEDFTSTESRTYFGRYAAGWMNAGEAHQGQELTIELLSNRGRDSTLEGIIGADGQFTTGFIEGRIRKETKAFRDKLQKACGFAGPNADAQFQEFLRAFQFNLAQRSLQDLRNHIEGELLDHQLGISDSEQRFTEVLAELGQDLSAEGEIRSRD